MQYRLWLLVAVAFCTVPITVAESQMLPVRVVNRGLVLDMAYGEPVSFFLEMSPELQLTDNQRETMFEIRRKLRRNTASYRKTLDSLRIATGIELEDPILRQAIDSVSFVRFQELSRPVADSLRVHNDAARNEVWALLTDRQQAIADSIVKESRTRRGRGPFSGPQRD